MPRMMLSSSAKRVSTCIIVQTIQTNIYIQVWMVGRKCREKAICPSRLTDLPQSVRRFSSTAKGLADFTLRALSKPMCHHDGHGMPS